METETEYNRQNGVYFRVMVSRDGGIVFPCMQWFDEFDYDQSRFLTDEHFDTEFLAREWVMQESVKAMGLLSILFR